MKKFLDVGILVFAVVFLGLLGVFAAVSPADAAAIRLNFDADDPLVDLPPETLTDDYLPKADLAASSKATLEYLRNRLYANHGYVFKQKKWKEEFERFDWYVPNEKFTYAVFNKFERENMRRILAAEKAKQ